MLVESLTIRARSYIASAELSLAAKCLDDALAIDPASEALLVLAGKVQLEMGDPEASLDHYTLAAHYQPSSWEAVSGQADALEKVGRLERASSLVAEFHKRNPLCSAAVLRLATVLRALQRIEDSVELLGEHLQRCPEDVFAMNLLGLILAREFNRLNEGASYLRKALKISPDLEMAKSNLAWVLAEAGQVSDSLSLIEEVLVRKPGDHETRLMRSLALLKAGKFRAGWSEYESRNESPTASRRSVLLRTLEPAESIFAGQIVVTAEQGLGDQIMFMSCLRDLCIDGVGGILECDKRLVELFRRSFPSFEVVAASTDDVLVKLASERNVRHRLPMGALPARYRSELTDFPAHQGYLCADLNKRKRWRERLALLGPGPYVGISWKGGSVQTRTKLRSIPPSLWSGILGLQGQFVSLQYGESDEDLDELSVQSGKTVHHWPEAIADYDETAALVCELDLIVSVCTAVIHLGGALGRPTWVLVPAVAEWRYLIRGTRMPWYPSVRLFRQAQGESWAEVMHRVVDLYRESRLG